MKNLDIEKLERRNIYKTPENFMEEMQKNVLQQTVSKKAGKVVELKWIYAAAAAVALLFGMTIFVDQSTTESHSTPAEPQIAKIENAVGTTILPVDKLKKEVVNADEDPERNIYVYTANDQREAAPQKAVSPKRSKPEMQKKIAAPANPEVQVDQILANFTSAELALVGRNSEQDVYLDLYN